MAINLLDSVKDAIAGQVADQLGSAVGLDKQQTASALKTVVPMLLGGMMKKASTPSGASELSAALRDTDTSILDNLGGLLGGGSSTSSLISMGTKLLPMLLGSSQSNIISLLVRLLGINDKSVGSLLGLLAPIVMAVVGKQAKSAGGFDVGALTNLLGGQKNFLSSAIPSELQGALGLVGDTSKAVTKATETAAASNPLQWLLPLIAVAVLGYLGWNFLSNRPQEAKQPVGPSVVAPPAGKTNLPNLPDLTDLKKSLTPTFDNLADVLAGIKDEEGARSALPKIEDAAKAFNTLGVDKLPSEAKASLWPFLKKALDRIQEAVGVAYKIPGVKDLIEPVLGPMIKSVQAIGG